MINTRSSVLIANEQPIVRFALSNFLTDLDCVEVCDEVSAPQDVIANVQTHRPRLLLTDICLNFELCFEMLELIGARYSETRILILTGLREELFAERALRAGAHGFVNTRAPMSEIAEGVSRVIAGDIYLSKGAQKKILGRLVGKHDRAISELCDSLTDRELSVFCQFGAGMTPRDIAGKLDLSIKTVETYRDRLKAKLNLKSTHQLMRYALECHVFDFNVQDMLKERPQRPADRSARSPK